MKKVIIAVVILSVILTAGILENCYINNVFDELDHRLASLEDALHDQSDEALTITREMTVWWESKRKNMELFTFSPDIRAFSVALGETEGSLECGDFDNAMSKCQSLMNMSRNMLQILDFNIEDII